jgi:hypothetical protein
MYHNAQLELVEMGVSLTFLTRLILNLHLPVSIS